LTQTPYPQPISTAQTNASPGLTAALASAGRGDASQRQYRQAEPGAAPDVLDNAPVSLGRWAAQKEVPSMEPTESIQESFFHGMQYYLDVSREARQALASAVAASFSVFDYL